MKLLPPLLAAALLSAGCAHFKTSQTKTDKDGATTTTTASATTFFDAKSSLAKFHAFQSDKSQSATVGGLDSETSSAGVVSIINAAAAAAGTAGKAAVVP